MNLDRTDRAILKVLQSEGRLSNADLADRVALSPSACHRRVRLLEDNEVIKSYAALLHPDRVDRGLSVIVLVTLENQRRETMERFERAISEIGEVMVCYLMTGAEDYLIRMQVKDARDYERVHRDRLSDLPGVTRLQSNIVMRDVFTRTELKLD